jgi:hypothetical protein
MDFHHPCIARPRAILIAEVLETLHTMYSLVRQSTQVPRAKTCVERTQQMRSLLALRPSPE